MLGKLKRFFYFFGAHYFRIYAQFYLNRWNPKVIVVTGSSGKTTLLHLIESQLGERAKYSHKANSSYGIPFDILGINRNSLTIDEWPLLFFKAPFQALRKIEKVDLYIVEADCDRPFEGKFLATLLQPNITLWLSSSNTHSGNFDRLIKSGKFNTTEDAIASEFAEFIKYTKEWSAINGDNLNILKALPQGIPKVDKIIKKEYLDNYQVKKDGTVFTILEQKYTVNALLPEETFYSIAMVKLLLNDLGMKMDPDFKAFSPPPGRSSVFSGIKGTTIIDSSYNATPEGMASTLKMFQSYPADKKWAVLGDMIELGERERAEHENLVKTLSGMDLKQLVLVGPRLLKYTYPVLQTLKLKYPVVGFEMPKEALNFMDKISGNETILFKGARFLEGVIERLLKDKKDALMLSRREVIWQKRRKAWQL